jgi:hypothetical protein
MVGNVVHRSVAEPIFRERLKQLDDEELAGAARTWIWQRDTALWPYEEDSWHCECVKQECERREKSDLFALAENKYSRSTPQKRMLLIRAICVGF